ncbi:ribosomal protein L13 [Thecamonas trahens ATCC 50062]|uniref:Ribosomal protein L13 n=1 Tax=Thecamonas trahens ATCC 50062 TaxID=461836 RepID=A0A0L0DCB9_THETB|nr:ribosomal protein L13 [Thecamonas trahens ATCC 50062]KNC49982.1 ribosomal protein L13 [Thecamonas trahens ATCC 50062]|eukprot:XP_013757151.1 ribosomal protein L13 [Thecamonas trahens ATCC 50062]
MALRVAQLAARAPKRWHVVDASGESLGRMAVKVARLLSGKDKPTYHASQTPGDYVLVLNARHLALSDKKLDSKEYVWHTQYAGGLKKATMRTVFDAAPDDVVRKAVLGMLPKTKDRKRFNRSLFVFPDDVHPFADDIEAYKKEEAELEAATAHIPDHVTSLLSQADSNDKVKALLESVGSKVTSLPDDVIFIGDGSGNNSNNSSN